jgi:hypothetical protein
MTPYYNQMANYSEYFNFTTNENQQKQQNIADLI